MNAPVRTFQVDAETAAILEGEVAAGRFASAEAALVYAVQQLASRRRAAAHLLALADEALADMDDLVDQETVERESLMAIDQAAR